MALFDSAIFDSAIFDTGAVEATRPATGGDDPLRRYLHNERESRKRQREAEAEEARKAKEQADKALERAEEVAEHNSQDVEPALEIGPPLPMYDPRVLDDLKGALATDIQAQLLAIAERQRLEAIAIQQAQDDEAARAFLFFMLAA